MEKKLINAICEKCGKDEVYKETQKIESKVIHEKVKIYCKNCGKLYKIDIR
ncbi:hypothetical protein 10S11_16 [uncultured Caudovirales phage]|uniref:Uncharacterized protein n=1 Tax=uncultured Caudovirales phage TaxID=2100421 RepID=A0A2H4J7I8_9CAUD|nr:hypothetical protein 10S11_16 [uncultured Caudovirales phage]